MLSTLFSGVALVGAAYLILTKKPGVSNVARINAIQSEIEAKEASITTLVDKEMKVVFNRTNGVIAKVEALVATQHGSVPTELLTQTLTALKAAQTTTATN